MGARALAVLLISAGTLSYEILLVRVFAIEQFHHFAYMAIGVAMLGFGTSGTLVALMPRTMAERGRVWFRRAAVLTPAALVLSAALSRRIPLDASQLAWDVGQWRLLGLVYILLALPFAIGALAVLLALELERAHAGKVYGASFVGSGLGSALAIASLVVAFPDRALALPVVLASLGSLAAVLGEPESGRGGRLAAWGVAVMSVAVLVRPPWSLEVSSYKGLPQVEAYPGARRVAERTSPLGWTVAVEAAAFRHAPGLSLKYNGRFPRQVGLFVDGEVAGAASEWGEERETLGMLDWLPSAAPFAVSEPGGVLVIGAGGGTEVWNALAHGARRVVALELNPELARLAGWSEEGRGASPEDARVQWAFGDARSWMARARERFEVISLGPGRSFGSTGAGVHALSEDFLHTVEAYSGYVERLEEDGILAVTRWLGVPPRESVRIVLTAAEALRASGGVAPGDGLVVLRSWATVTVMVRPAGFGDLEIERLRTWAAERNFDLDWYPGIEGPAARFNLLDEPVLYRAAEAATAGSEEAARFVAAYPLSVGPVSDARPYPHHFLRAGALPTLLRGDRGAWLPFAEWGYVALLATLIQSLVLAGLLIVGPAAAGRAPRRVRRWGRVIAYFGAIGLAYLTAELAAIQQLTLLLGHPVFAVAAVLSAFLVCSGLGSAWSDAQPVGRGPWLTAGISVMLALYAVGLLEVVHWLQPAHVAVRAACGLALLAPLAFLMGLPFPIGLRRLVGDEGGLAWAWAANGFASVVAAPLAALISLEAGSPVILALAALLYAGAALIR